MWFHRLLIQFDKSMEWYQEVFKLYQNVLMLLENLLEQFGRLMEWFENVFKLFNNPVKSSTELVQLFETGSKHQISTLETKKKLVFCLY